MIAFNETPPQGTVRDWLDQQAEARGERIAYRFTDGAADLSWANLRDIARARAQGLTALGMAKGESLAVMMPNGRAALETLFAGLYGGFRVTMINLAAGNDAITYAFEHCEARFACVGAEQQAQFAATCPDGLRPMPDDLDLDAQVPLHPLSSGDDALLMYTSGTTGRPKGVVHSHSSLLAGGWTTARAHALSEHDCGYCVLPICHINGLCVSVMGCLISGGQLLLAPKFSNSRFWGDIEAGAVTWFSVVPTIISHVLHSTQDPSDAARAKLRFGRSASSALAPEVQTAFETRFGVPIVETMGMTETAAQMLSNPLPPATRKIGSPGIAIGNQVTILRSDLLEASHNEQGEIAIRGPNVMKEYLKNPDETRASFTPDGWLRSGDLGHKDEEGYVFVTGRLKELIIKGGENIAPREVDEALYAHADVVEAAAFAQPCTTYGERVVAAVTLCADSSVTAPDLIDICTRRLGAFKAPDTVYILEDLPKGPSGKIQRKKLADMMSST